MQIILKYLTTFLLSNLAKELAGEVVVVTLRRLAKNSSNTLDDELVEVLESKLKLK